MGFFMKEGTVVDRVAIVKMLTFPPSNRENAVHSFISSHEFISSQRADL